MCAKKTKSTSGKFCQISFRPSDCRRHTSGCTARASRRNRISIWQGQARRRKGKGRFKVGLDVAVANVGGSGKSGLNIPKSD